MSDPMVGLVLFAWLRGGALLTAVWAQRIALRGRRDLALLAAATPGLEFAEQHPRHGSWHVRSMNSWRSGRG